MHVVCVDYDDISARCNVFCPGAVKSLGSLIDNTNAEGVMDMTGKALLVIARLKHVNAT